MTGSHECSKCVFGHKCRMPEPCDDYYPVTEQEIDDLDEAAVDRYREEYRGAFIALFLFE